MNAHDDYVMQHDVYSLGVCLLELGLWESSVEWGEHDGEGMEGEVVAPLPSAALGLSLEDFDVVDGDDEKGRKPGFRIKERLVELARRRLPLRMGDRYAAVVVTCLTCLDGNNEGFGGDEAEMEDEDGVLVGTRFIERVLFRLGEISI